MPLIKIKECVSEGPCKGQTHEWAFTQPRLKELRVLQAKTGMTLQKFMDELNEMSAEAITALVDLLHRRDGIDLRWDDIDVDFDGFELTQTEEELAQLMTQLEETANEGKDADAGS